MRAIALVILWLTPSVFVFASDYNERAEALVRDFYSDARAGAAVIVSRDGEVLLRTAVGQANLELAVPLAPDHLFKLASVSKQYTAAAILALVQDGEMALDDRLETLLPDFPIKDVTLHQLLNHTSGIRSYTDLPNYMNGPARLDLDTAGLIATFVNEPVDFAPGSEWRYNNSGYILLAAIIERATGKAWDAFIRERLLLPNGLERTAYYPDAAIVPGRVAGYQGADDSLANAALLSMTQPHGAGALFGTVDEVDAWQRALHQGGLLRADLYQAMITPVATDPNTPDGQGYGYGLAVSKLRGRDAIEHGGGIFGFSTQALWLPEAKLSVVVLSNVSGPRSPAALSRRLAALALDDLYPIDQPNPETPVPESALQELVGTYRINDSAFRTLRLEDGRLLSQRQGGQAYPIRALTPSLLALEGSVSYLEAVRDEAGKLLGLNMFQNGEAPPEFAEWQSAEVQTRADLDLPAEHLQRLVGDYELQPGFVMTMRVREGRLSVQATNQAELPLNADSPLRFYSPVAGADFLFELPETGPASAVTLEQGGRTMPAPRIVEAAAEAE